MNDRVHRAVFAAILASLQVRAAGNIRAGPGDAVGGALRWGSEGEPNFFRLVDRGPVTGKILHKVGVTP